MMLRRRTFLAAAGTAVVGGPFAVVASARYPFTTLDEAWRSVGFDPGDSRSATFVVAAHYGVCAEDGIRPIIAQVNAMRPRPAFFLFNGDLIHDGSQHFGQRPDAAQQRVAVEQLKMFRQDLEQLDPWIARKLTLGNHDTYPGEDEPELFHRVFPEAPAYQVFDLAGVKMVALNGHHDGRIDPRQRDWLESTVKTFDPDASVIVFVHQPALGQVVRERLIGPAIEQAFDKHRGPVWLIGGHVHRNAEQAFALAQTTVVQASIVCAGAGIWGGPEKPGYWVFGLHHGRIAARVFHRLGHGYRVAPVPDRRNPSPIRRPFESTEGILWRTMVGEDDGPYRRDHDAADAGSWWAYVRQLTYRLPLRRVAAATGMAILAGGLDKAEIELAVTPDDWRTVEAPPARDGVYTVTIPEAWHGSEWCDVRVRAGDAELSVAGFALLKG
jgi:hypothetical protein